MWIVIKHVTFESVCHNRQTESRTFCCRTYSSSRAERQPTQVTSTDERKSFGLFQTYNCPRYTPATGPSDWQSNVLPAELMGSINYNLYVQPVQSSYLKHLHTIMFTWPLSSESDGELFVERFNHCMVSNLTNEWACTNIRFGIPYSTLFGNLGIQYRICNQIGLADGYH